QEQKGKPGFVPSQLTKAIAQSDSLQAKVTTLQQQVTLADKQLAEQQANEKLVGFNLNQAKAELEQAKLRLANTVVKSPIQGYIAQENINPGVLVQSSQYLMSVISLENVWITANIKESQIERVIIGYPVTIVLSAFPSITFYGEVESISPAAGSEFALIPTDNASGNFIKTEALIPVRIRILRTKDFGRLLPGMNATVTILTDPLNDHDETVQKYNKVKAQVEADEEAHGQKTTPAMKETTPAKTDFQAGKQSPEQSPTADTDGAHEALTQGIAEGMETKAESKE
ncbi:MAG: efflux RND transporter periplasmic adaptor subunit, partial [Verrucomicrobiota bacterium]